MKKELLIILGNQLFPTNKLKTIGCNNIFMAEDIGLCTYVKHHKQKIAFFLTAMRDYRDELSANKNARSLWGTVIFKPWPPLEKNSFTLPLKFWPETHTFS